MIKKIAISLVALLVLVFGGAYFYLDAIIKSGIETVGPRVLGTGVTVNSVSISPLTGQGRITGLIVENPEPFNAENIFELTDVEVNVDVSSLFSDVIVVESVIIEQPVITYETRITSDNIRTLLENVSSGQPDSDSEAPAEASTKRVIVRDFQLNGSRVELVAANVSAPVQLPDIQLQNIGEEGDAASYAQVLRTVLAAVSRAIVNADLPNFEQLEGAARERLEDGAQQVEDAVEDLGNRLRNILN